MVSLTTVVKGSARNPQNAETAEITVTTVVQEVDLDTPSWMVAQAIKAKETLKGAMLVTPMQPDVLP